MNTFVSIATWPKNVILGDVQESRDYHDTREAAEAVCRALVRHGLGGEGKIFPLETRVEEGATTP